MAEGKKGGCLRILGIIFLVLIGLVVVACVVGGGSSDKKDFSADSSSSSSTQTQSDSGTSTDDTPKYTVSNEAADTSGYYVKITGELTNNTDKDVNYIQVEYVLYDASGAQVGTAYATTTNLKAGGMWRYEAVSTKEPSEIASFELADVTGF